MATLHCRVHRKENVRSDSNRQKFKIFNLNNGLEQNEKNRYDHTSRTDATRIAQQILEYKPRGYKDTGSPRRCCIRTGHDSLPAHADRLLAGRLAPRSPDIQIFPSVCEAPWPKLQVTLRSSKCSVTSVSFPSWTHSHYIYK
jgi:hypothetical protein